MTDPNGLCFLSYRRARTAEVGLLVGALRDHGIPTWQDVSDLPNTPTEEELRRVLTDPAISSAILFLTPEVEHSPIIRNVEAPGIIRRHLAGDGFFAVPITAGGLDYGDVARVIGPNVGPTSLPGWNIHRTRVDPLDPQSASQIAVIVLQQRLATIHRTLTAGEPIRLVATTRTPLPKVAPSAIALDLTHRFVGRSASASAWSDHVLPGMRAIATTLSARAPGRPIEMSGLVAIPAAVALGAAFLSVGGSRTVWMQDQQTFGKPREAWGLHVSRRPSGYKAVTHSREPTAKDVAVLVSVAADVTADFNTMASSLPPLRAIVAVAPATGFATRQILSAPEASDVAHVVVEAIRTARSTYHGLGTVHLFLAVPLGLAMMIGQLSNTFGSVQTYEHVPGAISPYQAAALLTPSV